MLTIQKVIPNYNLAGFGESTPGIPEFTGVKGDNLIEVKTGDVFLIKKFIFKGARVVLKNTTTEEKFDKYPFRALLENLIYDGHYILQKK